MFARVTRVEGSADKVDAGIESFNAQVLPRRPREPTDARRPLLLSPLPVTVIK